MKDKAKAREEMKSRYNVERYKYAVNVASGLFLERGIEAVKMTDIAENCGIGVASLYRYFETKTEIVIRSGIILWEKIRLDFWKYLSERKEGKTGLEDLSYDLAYFKNLFANHKNFIKFLDDFDRIMLSEKVDKNRLEAYEKSIVDFYEPFCDSVKKGREDGTIKKDVDVATVYVSVTHALIAVCQKFIRGEILPGDDFSVSEKEIEKLLEITAAYLAA
ncbi:MAG: TetR/AcrR family transcriptional regulator [Treponema sp.]|nr:TetR/AcrR family transcriptional regulator [Treponema sp.]